MDLKFVRGGFLFFLFFFFPSRHTLLSIMRSELLTKASDNCLTLLRKLAQLYHVGFFFIYIYIMVSLWISANFCRFFYRCHWYAVFQVQLRSDQNTTWIQAAQGENCSGAPSVKWWFWGTESEGPPKTRAINRWSNERKSVILRLSALAKQRCFK